MSIKRISVLNLCQVLKPFVKSTPGLKSRRKHDLSEPEFYGDLGRVVHQFSVRSRSN